MNKKIKVTFRGNETLEFEEGTTYKEISDNFRHYFQFDILAAKVDNDIVDLSDTLKKRCNIDFIDRTTSVGNSIYVSSATFILVLAVRNILGELAEVTTEHSIDKGIFCTIKGADIDKNVIDRIYQEMRNIVEQDYLYTKLSVSRIDAIKYFK